MTNRGSGWLRFVLPVAIACIIATGSIVVSCSSPSDGDPTDAADTNLVVEDALVLGTIVTLRVHAARDMDVLESQVRGIIDEMEELGCRLSLYCESSETRRVNQAAGDTVEISEEFGRLLGYGLEVAERSGGVFDPTVGPLVEIWGFYSGDHRVPSEAEIEGAMDLVDWSRVDLDGESLSFDPGMRLDLEALMKGYVADFALERFEELGVSGALIIAGPSSIGALGTAPGGRPWRIGLEHPRNTGSIYGALDLHDGEHVSTSGDYQRYFIDDEGIRRSHIINARTGRPADSGIMAVTVVSDSSLGADGVSTAAMPMSPEDAIAFIDEWGDGGLEGLVVTTDGRILYTDRMRERVEMVDGGL